jgi:hypothetical protein
MRGPRFTMCGGLGPVQAAQWRVASVHVPFSHGINYVVVIQSCLDVVSSLHYNCLQIACISLHVDRSLQTNKDTSIGFVFMCIGGGVCVRERERQRE